MTSKAIILINTGTPLSPDVKAVRAFLKRFLSDKAVIDLPDWLWKPILYTHVLPLRTPPSSRRYAAVWMKEGSPQVVFMNRIAQKLATRVASDIIVRSAFLYSDPDVQTTVKTLAGQGVKEAVFLPLYPQYARQTVGSARIAIENATKDFDLKTSIIEPYGKDDAYVELVARHIASYRQNEHLVMSFHGLPVKAVNVANPYDADCYDFAKKLAQKLDLKSDDYSVAFQSKFGHGAWLSPYLADTLTNCATQKRSVDVAALSFACDCLETLEEIGLAHQKAFMAQGGTGFQLIPALNDDDTVIDFYARRAQASFHA